MATCENAGDGESKWKYWRIVGEARATTKLNPFERRRRLVRSRQHGQAPTASTPRVACRKCYLPHRENMEYVRFMVRGLIPIRNTQHHPTRTADATRKQLATAMDVRVTEGPAWTSVVSIRLRGSRGESVVCTCK